MKMLLIEETRPRKPKAPSADLEGADDPTVPMALPVQVSTPWDERLTEDAAPATAPAAPVDSGSDGSGDDGSGGDGSGGLPPAPEAGADDQP